MTDDYYSDRVRGPRPRTLEEADDAIWGGVYALLERSIDSGALAREYPLRCEDGGGIYACDRDGLMATLRAEIPDLGWPLSTYTVPPTLAILDLLEFIFRHAYHADDGAYHSYYKHHHLRFDRDEGRREFHASINRLLARSGTVYELSERGRIERTVPSVVAAGLRHELPATKDVAFDQLMATAASKFLDRDPAVRQDGLEKLWDAFERCKTVIASDKKAGVTALIAVATHAADSAEATLLEQEFRALTTIGNEYRIRHHETAAAPLSMAAVDHLFVRMYACLLRVHPALRP